MINKNHYHDLNIIKEKALKYRYALIYMLSEVKLLANSINLIIDWDEILEARFFDQSGELHIFKYDNSLKAIEILEGDSKEDAISIEYELADKYKAIGIGLEVKQYIDYDEDGQAYVELTRLNEIVRR